MTILMPQRHLLSTIDAHAGGEPLRLITSGFPRPQGDTILERRADLLANHDHLRRALMWEPRGHADMYGAILTEPVTEGADFGVIFMHNEGYSTMCGHGIIAVTTILIETGMFPVPGDEATIGFDSPAGFISAKATVSDGRVQTVAFQNVPSFVFRQNLELTTERGPVTVHIVFGGAFYALVELNESPVAVDPSRVSELINFGMQVKHEVERQFDVHHPLEPDLQGIYGTIIAGTPCSHDADGRNVTIFADGEVDRSPCGTGTAARIAWLHASGELATDSPYVHESIIGAKFTGRVTGETMMGEFPAVETEIAGQASITGYHTFVIDPDDPFRAGFLVR